MMESIILTNACNGENTGKCAKTVYLFQNLNSEYYTICYRKHFYACYAKIRIVIKEKFIKS